MLVRNAVTLWQTGEMSDTPAEAETRCKFGAPAVREGKRPTNDEPDRPTKDEPDRPTKLFSRDGKSSLSSDVSLWFAAKVCTTCTSPHQTPTQRSVLLIV